MDIRDYFVQFGAFSDKRISKKQKQRYLSRLLKYYEELGYKTKIIQNKHKRNNSYIGIFGDIKRAKRVLLTYYDTPVIDFLKEDYKPFDDIQKRKKSTVNYTISLLICLVSVFLLIYFYLYPQLTNGNFNFHDVLAVGLFLIGFTITMKVSKEMGFSKKNNLVRNTSSVVTLMLHAKEMKELNRQKEVAFVFVDHGSTSYYSYQVLKQYLQNEKLEDRQEFIFLDVIGAGDVKFVTSDDSGDDKRSQTLDDLYNNPTYIYGAGVNKEQDYQVMEEAISETLAYLSKRR